MKKIKFLIVPVLAAALLTGCSPTTVNQSPELRGVGDKTCLVNSTVDLLDGVAALDTEDGDITPDIEITIIPQVAVENGYATFSKAGEYEVVYRVADSEGKTFQSTSFVNVVDRDVYNSSVITNGFSLEVGGSAKVIADGLNGGVYSFKTSGAEISQDVKLARKFDMVCGEEYTFIYHFNSNLSGRIKAAADGVEIASLSVNAGENVLSFKHFLPKQTTSDGATLTDFAVIELWLGGLEGELEFSLSKVETERYQENTGLVEKLPDFKFNDKIHDRFDQTSGSVGLVDDGKGAYVEITKAATETWRGGMFINTGLALNSGAKFTVSYDLELRNDGQFEVILQNKQWDEKKLYTSTTAGRNEFEITVTDQIGTLWIYVASGACENRVTIKNLSVKSEEGGFIKQSFDIGSITAKHSEGADGTIKCEYGKIVYDVKRFGNTDWHNEVTSPQFYLSGAADNFVITFKAKATKPVWCIFIAHDAVAQDWTTFAWKQIRIPEEETTVSIRCDNKSLDSYYNFIWQFGSTANTAYTDVTIEISDIKICYKSDLEG